MENNKTTKDQDSTQSGRNETLDQPGSKVADYGNPSGGSADGVSTQRNTTARPDEAEDGRHTLGNP